MLQNLATSTALPMDQRPTRRLYSLKWGVRWALYIHLGWLVFTLLDLAFFTRQPVVVAGAPVEVILDKNLPFEPIQHGHHKTNIPLPPKVTDKPSPTPPPQTNPQNQPKEVYQTASAKKGPKALPKKKTDNEKPIVKPKLAGALKNLQDTTTKADNNHNVRQGSQSGSDDEDDELQAAVKRQFIPCWNVDAVLNAPNPEKLLVTVRIQLKRDGSVSDAQIESPKSTADVFHRIAMNEARNAVLDPRCQPLKLPANKYNKWKTIVLAFDPREAGTE